MKAERLAEGMEARHCALSLVGEPIMYPEINALVKLLHEKKISTFLVTNAQFPDAIRFSVCVQVIFLCVYVYACVYMHMFLCVLSTCVGMCICKCAHTCA